MYIKLTAEKKAEIGKRAAEHGVAATTCTTNILSKLRKAASALGEMHTLRKSGRGGEKEMRTSL